MKITDSILQRIEELYSQMAPLLDSDTEEKKTSGEIPSDSQAERLEEELEEILESIDFLIEKKKLSGQFLEEIKNNFVGISVEDKKIILALIKSDNQGNLNPDITHQAETISQDELLREVQACYDGLEHFIVSAKQQIELISHEIQIENQKEDQIEETLLDEQLQKVEAEEGARSQQFEKESADFARYAREIDELLEKLNNAASEEVTEDKIDSLRATLNQS